jgi:transcriptional regulator with XRE-family HTH domain
MDKNIHTARVKNNPLPLRALRALVEPKISQCELAKRVASHLTPRTFSVQRYWQIENGYGAAPDGDEAAAIAKVLGMGVVDIAWSTDIAERRTA